MTLWLPKYPCFPRSLLLMVEICHRNMWCCIFGLTSPHFTRDRRVLSLSSYMDPDFSKSINVRNFVPNQLPYQGNISTQLRASFLITNLLCKRLMQPLLIKVACYALRTKCKIRHDLVVLILSVSLSQPLQSGRFIGGAGHKWRKFWLIKKPISSINTIIHFFGWPFPQTMVIFWLNLPPGK